MDRLSLYESDLRRFNNKKKRQRQLKRNISLVTVMAILTIIFSVTLSSIFAIAESHESDRLYKYYTSIEVKYGETLWSIAKEYINNDHYSGIPAYIKEVMKINSLPDDNIRAGQYLIVPYFSSGISELAVLN